jgi:macrolide transport system ATP-binding/permease protein
VGAWLSCELSKPHLPDWVRSGTSRWLAIFGRTKPDVSLAAARDSLLPLQSQLLEPWMLQNNRSLELSPCGRGSIPGTAGQSAGHKISLFLYTVAFLVLAVACANLASLLLSRGANRRREIAIRMAMGAPRWRLVRQLLAETALLSVLGGLFGLLLSTWGVRLAALALPKIARNYDLDLALPIDWRIIAYTLAASLVVALFCGLVPAWRGTRVDCQAALKDETLGIGPKSRWFELRNLLVVSQVAVSVMLLIGGGVMLRSLLRVQDQTFAFNYDHCVVTALWDKDAATTPAEHERLRRELLESARTLPGVTSASFSSHPPLAVGTTSTSVSEPQTAVFSEALINDVTPGFFDSLKIPMVLGRDFSIQEAGRSNDVVIVNESLAANLWPNQSPIGRSLHYDRDYQVVGVVKDACYWTPTDEPRAGFYRCQSEATGNIGGHLIVRTDRDTRPLRSLVASLVRQADPGHEQPYVTDYADLISVGMLAQRTTAWVLGLASAIGLALVGAGLYGVLSYHIAQRTREIGIRMALGAGRGHVMRSMLLRGVLLVSVGLVGGGAAGVFAAILLDKILYKTSPADPVTLVIVLLLMLGVVLLACWFPARRAAQVDPMVALRNE